MEDRALEVTEDFDGTEEFVEIVGQTSLRVAFFGIWEDFNLRVLALGLWWEPGVHCHEAVAHKVAHSRHNKDEY
jgi:hypothetical protein